MKIHPADRISGKPAIFSKNNRLIPGRTMIELLKDIKEKLNAGVYKNEEHIRLSLVVRVLQALGWSIWNPEEVFPEFVVVPKEDSTRVDIALFVSPQFPTVFIEVKAHKLLMNKLAQVEMQVRDYNRNNTAAFSVLTDGQFWRFYFSQTGGEFAQKCFQDFDLFEVDLDDAATIFQAFLSRSAHQSGSATQVANQMLQLTQKQKHILGLLDEAKKLTEMAPFPRLPEALQTLAASKGIFASVEEISDILAGKPTKPRNPIPYVQTSEPSLQPAPPQSVSIAKEKFDLILNPADPKDLGHTKITMAMFNGLYVKNWNELAQQAIRFAYLHDPSLNVIRRFANVSDSERLDSGFKPVEGTPIWSQFMDANKSWRTAMGIANYLKVPVIVEFLWRDKPNVANRGKTGLLNWSPE